MLAQADPPPLPSPVKPSRLAGVMVVLVGLSWCVSTGKTVFPNCVNGSIENRWFAVGALSQIGQSSVFITRHPEDPGRGFWAERFDGFYCGFIVPTVRASEHSDLRLTIGATMIGWDLPYWSMLVVWLGVLWLSPRRRLGVADLMLQTGAIAVYLTLAQLRMSLPLLVAVHLLTVAVGAPCLVRLVFWRRLSSLASQAAG